MKYKGAEVGMNLEEPKQKHEISVEKSTLKVECDARFIYSSIGSLIHSPIQH